MSVQATPKEDNIIYPDFMSPVTGRREKPKGKIKIPKFDELPKVKGKFHNIETPGTIHTFTCRFWKGAPVTFNLMDGGEYVIPKVVADHLNEQCYYKKNRWISSDGTISTAKPVLVGGRGFQRIGNDFTKEIDSKTHRFMFQILGVA